MNLAFNRPFDAVDPILIRGSRDPYGWLGNMSPFPLSYEGEGYRTAEALFQCLRVSDEETRELIRAEKSPMGAKLKAKEHADKRTTIPLSETDLDLMRLVLRLKIQQYPQLEMWLRKTGTTMIVEDCTRRQHGTGLFWGAAHLGGEKWTGVNMLWNLWMVVRMQLKPKSDPLEGFFT